VNYSATFRFECPYAEKLYTVLAPEAGSDPGDRSQVSVFREGDSVTLQVKAEDIPALRASLNMWLRLVNVCKEVLEM
jgi:KEOPS complex subunit Pcc1